MAVSSTTNRLAYSGNGVTTIFSFPDYLINDTDLKVVARDAAGNEVLKVLNTDYTLAFIGAAVNGVYPAGANITMLVAPPNLTFLSLYRDPPQTQGTHWTDNDPMPASSLENTVDKAVLLIQRLKDMASRCISLTEGFVASFNMHLPAVIPIDSALVTNHTGDGFVFVATSTFVGAPGPAGPTGPTGPAGPSGSGSMLVNPAAANVTLVAGAPDSQYIPCDATAGAFNVTLPPALVGIEGQLFVTKKVDASANSVAILPTGGDVILGTTAMASAILDYQGKSLSFVCRAAGFWDLI